jgi:hypothetical protein
MFLGFTVAAIYIGWIAVEKHQLKDEIYVQSIFKKSNSRAGARSISDIILARGLK